MSNIYFKPHVGKNYSKQNPKIIMLGESHYLWKENQTPENYHDDGKTLSQDVIESVMDDELPSQQTFNNAKAVITGDYHSDNRDFWQSVIFYNYIQGFVGNSALEDHRDKQYFEDDKENMLQKSKLALAEMLDAYSPNLVIVWGKGMADNWLPEWNWEWIDETLQVWKYKQFPNTIFWTIKHPSMAFSYDKYHTDYQKVKKYL